MRQMGNQLPARRQTAREHAAPQDGHRSQQWHEKQRYLGEVMVALEADKLSVEEQMHLRRILERCY